MDRDVSVSLLKSVVLLDVVEVISSQHYCPLHLLTLDNTCQNPTTNADVPSEGALLVNVCALSGLQRNNCSSIF